MNIWSDSFIDGGLMPPECALGVIDPVKRVRFSRNRNPHLAWDDVPHGTRSLALLCHDRDVPGTGADVNQPDRRVPLLLPRVDFYHWTLVVIPLAHVLRLVLLVSHFPLPLTGSRSLSGSSFSGEPNLPALPLS